MRDKIKSKFNNAGSGIVTVIIAISFLTITGTLIMFLSYTGIEMKVSEKKGRQATYDASMAIDEVRLGFTEVVSDAMNDCYSDTLKYLTANQASFSTGFKTSFVSFLNDYTPDELKDKPNSYDKTLVSGSVLLHNLKWNPEVIRLMIKTIPVPTGGASLDSDQIKIVTPTTKREVVVTDEEIRFNNISVEYTSEEGRVTKITSDIVITYPDMSYSINSISMFGVPSFSIICGGDLSQNIVNTKTIVTGNAYAGSLTLSGSSQFEFTGDTFVTGGNVSVDGAYGDIATFPDDYEAQYNDIVDKARFKVGRDSTFWARNIDVGTNSYLALLGTALVGNDLDIQGNNAHVALAGSYTGFGNSKTSAIDSSAININGKHTVLNVRSLQQLCLAGYSFIGELQYTENDAATDTRMAESASVRANQRAYLVPVSPVSYIKIAHNAFYDDRGTLHSAGYYNPPTNPDVMTSNELYVRYKINTFSSSSSFDSTSTIWTLDGEEKSYSSYGAYCKPAIIYAGNDQYLVYYFLQFDTEDHATDYFKDYMRVYPDRINDYVNNYVKVGSTAANMSTLGYEFIKYGDVLGSIRSASVTDKAEEFKTSYANLCATLKDNVAAETEGQNPFTYYINVDEEVTAESVFTASLAADCTGHPVYFYENGNTNKNPIAVCYYGNYTFTGGTDTDYLNGKPVNTQDLKLIIASGSVTINHDFTGLVMCGGNMVLNANVTLKPNATDVEIAYASRVNSDVSSLSPRYLFKVSIGEYTTEGKTYDGGIASYITYENWKKN